MGNPVAFWRGEEGVRSATFPMFQIAGIVYSLKNMALL